MALDLQCAGTNYMVQRNKVEPAERAKHPMLTYFAQQFYAALRATRDEDVTPLDRRYEEVVRQERPDVFSGPSVDDVPPKPLQLVGAEETAERAA